MDYSFDNSLFKYNIIYLFLAVLGLPCTCGEQGLLFLVVLGLLIAVASLAVQHAL